MTIAIPTVAILGDDLIKPLHAAGEILDTLDSVKQQQVLELLWARHLRRVSSLTRERGLVMTAFERHVWQIIDQIENTAPGVH